MQSVIKTAKNIFIHSVSVACGMHCTSGKPGSVAVCMLQSEVTDQPGRCPVEREPDFSQTTEMHTEVICCLLTYVLPVITQLHGLSQVQKALLW